jgi:hypothetical protein
MAVNGSPDNGTPVMYLLTAKISKQEPAMTYKFLEIGSKHERFIMQQVQGPVCHRYWKWKED